MAYIRSARKEDASRLLEIYAPYVVETAITFEYEIPSLAEFEKRIETTKETYPYLVIEENSVVQGYAYASPLKERAAYDWSCELSIYLDKGAKHKGYGRALYEELENKLKSMGILNLYACIGYPIVEDEYLDMNSAKFHAHLGFQKVGHFHSCGYKFNRWYDMIWMEKIIGDHKNDLPPIQKDRASSFPR